MGGDKYVAALAGDEVEERIGDELRSDWERLFNELLPETAPVPDVVCAALEKAGSRDAVMVGDTPWDVDAARRAGLETLG